MSNGMEDLLIDFTSVIVIVAIVFAFLGFLAVLDKVYTFLKEEK